MPNDDTTPPSRPQVEVFIATSLDGFIARPDGSLDWLMEAQAAAPAGEDFGYAEFMAGIDALVMGRKTFETVLGFDPWPYAERPVWVLSRQQGLEIPEALRPRVQRSGAEVRTLLRQLAQQGVRRLYLDGGELIQHFLFEDLVDRITLTTVPLLLGQGRSLWGPLPADRAWTLEAARHWEGGFVQGRYARRRGAGSNQGTSTVPL
ncbi:MAG: dihydrofolate reductase [Rubrivivax sp.]|nr:dihydrofolate reductase [Rubrivivax sp.]